MQVQMVFTGCLAAQGEVSRDVAALRELTSAKTKCMQHLLWLNGKQASKQARKQASKQASKPTIMQVSQQASMQIHQKARKQTTHRTPPSKSAESMQHKSA